MAIQNLPVVFALDRAGLVGADGATHAGAYDIAFLRCIPNMGIACPHGRGRMPATLSSAYAQSHPVAVRYPRGAGAGVTPPLALDALPFGKGDRRGQRIAILAFGTLLYPALEAGEALGATANMRWAKPLDSDLLREIAATHDAGHGGGGRRHGRRGRRIAANGHRQAAAATGPARSLHRAWRSGQAAGGCGARRSGHPGVDRSAARRGRLTAQPLPAALHEELRFFASSG